MIHLHDTKGHRWITDEDLAEEHPGLHAALHEPRPFNEGGEKIKKLRKKYNLTIRELAEASGISLGDLSAIETGRVEPTQGQVEAIQRALQSIRLSSK